MKKIVEVEHLRKSYGAIVAVEDVSFDVVEGEIFGLLGPNGAGKTTTVECLQGLRPPDSGRIAVLGLDPRSQSPQLRKQIGAQLQESGLPDRIKVWEALDLFASVSAEATDWESTMEQWGLQAKRNATFASLSGGQRQRLFVALALVNNPKLVFLDEMTTGLDPAARRAAWELVREMRERGTTVVLVTHFMEEAEHLCDRVAVVNKGRVGAIGTPQGLINTYADEVRVIFSSERNDLSWLASIPAVQGISKQGPRVTVVGRGPVLALVAAALVQHDIIPSDLRTEQPTLEDVFLRITSPANEEQ